MAGLGAADSLYFTELMNLSYLVSAKAIVVFEGVNLTVPVKGEPLYIRSPSALEYVYQQILRINQ